jgi:serine/threonine-protein kinase
VIHRDIKPENILLSRGEPVVADFGIALAAASAGRDRLTETGLSLGTPTYMSPEQAAADPRLDGRSDQYSLACVVYEMLAGEPPYTGPTAQAIMAKRLGEPVPHLGTMRQVAPAVEDVVARALARAPADRYPTVSQFAHALASASVSGASAGSAPLPRSRRLRWASLAALALLTLLGGWWGASKARTESAMRRSVALLPCENTGPGPEAAFIGERWSEELIQKLVRVGGLNPNAWASVRRYRDSPLALRRIGAELHAGTLVRCRIAELPTGTDLSVQLIRADDERVMWSNDYGRPPGAEGINSAQSTAARDIAQALGLSLPPRALASLERPLTRDTVALRLYRLGIH